MQLFRSNFKQCRRASKVVKVGLTLPFRLEYFYERRACC